MRGNTKWLLALAILGFAVHCRPGSAQAIVSEDFTGGTTSNPWYFFNGACLTAGTTAVTGPPEEITRLTGEPSNAGVPPEGFCEITKPSGTVVEGCLVVVTSNDTWLRSKGSKLL